MLCQSKEDKTHPGSAQPGFLTRASLFNRAETSLGTEGLKDYLSWVS